MAIAQQTFRIKSFVRRSGRATTAQERARENLWPQYGLQVENGLIDYSRVLGRESQRMLEIGFGTGQSLLAAAKANPGIDFIGVETHKPGIGALMLGVELGGLTNLRAYDADVIDVLEKCVPDASLDGVLIFFPDPWQKRRHNARRLVQPAFLKLIITKIKPGGVLHLATDWEDYAKHMQRVTGNEERLINLAGANQFGGRSPYRPILSKFERRAIREGRSIWEFQFCIDIKKTLT